MKKVLLVEDDEKIRSALEFALAEEGYEVIPVETGESALKIVCSNAPDIILLDIMLPGMDGFEVCASLKSAKDYKSIPIIMMTAMGDSESIIKGLTAGADDYVSKPFNMRELVARLKSHLRMKELYDITKREEEEKSALLDVSKSLSSTVTPHETLFTVVSKIAETIEVKRCSIIYVDILKNNAYVMASHDSNEINHLEIDIRKYPEIQKVMNTGEQVIINDVFNDPILLPVREVLNLIEIKSIMAFPISFRDTLIGTLILRTSRRESPFNEREIKFCDVISHLAAAPLKNAYQLEILKMEKKKELEKRLAAESKSKASRVLFEMTIEASPIPICVFDREGNITDVNTAYLKEWSKNKSRPKVIGVNILESGMEGRQLDFVKEILRGGKPRVELDSVYPREKEKRTYIFQGVPLYDLRDELIGGVFTTDDITGYKRTQEELRKAKEEADEANAIKDKFVSLVAHDLKSPFSSILGLMKLIQVDQKNPPVKKHKDLITRVLTTGENLVDMIDKVLAISRIQTGKMKPLCSFVDANKISSAVAGNLSYIAEKKGIEIVNNIPPGVRLYADTNLFSQVIQNLIGNSLKFCHIGAQVSLFIPHGKKTAIAVKDNGIGIKAKRLPGIFKHEEKTSTIGTDGETGTGLGLPLCHDIMTAHGGSITAESVEGVGSVFSVELPYARPKVLIVDDEEIIRLEEKKYLKTIDVDILEAGNGEEALEILGQTTPHLIITNILMPVMDGIELLLEVKKNKNRRPIPVIVVTADPNMEIRNKAFQSGADDFIPKPLDPEDFIPRVRRFIC